MRKYSIFDVGLLQGKTDVVERKHRKYAFTNSES